MREILGQDLPAFSNADLEKLKNGLDFIGINHYSSFYIKDCKISRCEPGAGASKTEGFALRTAIKEGRFIGEPVCDLIISLLVIMITIEFFNQSQLLHVYLKNYGL